MATSVLVGPESCPAQESPALSGVEDCNATLYWAVERTDETGADLSDRFKGSWGLSEGALRKTSRPIGGGCSQQAADHLMLDESIGLSGWKGSTSVRPCASGGVWSTACNNIGWGVVVGEVDPAASYEVPVLAV